MNTEKILELEGNANDLLMINNEETMYSTRLIHFDADSKEENEEVIDITVTSTNMGGEHPIFEKIIGKKIRLTLETLE